MNFLSPEHYDNIVLVPVTSNMNVSTSSWMSAKVKVGSPLAAYSSISRKAKRFLFPLTAALLSSSMPSREKSELESSWEARIESSSLARSWITCNIIKSSYWSHIFSIQCNICSKFVSYNILLE